MLSFHRKLYSRRGMRRGRVNYNDHLSMAINQFRYCSNHNNNTDVHYCNDADFRLQVPNCIGCNSKFTAKLFTRNVENNGVCKMKGTKEPVHHSGKTIKSIIVAYRGTNRNHVLHWRFSVN